MSVKVIVTDMDGTFLNDAKTYNQPNIRVLYCFPSPPHKDTTDLLYNSP